MRSARTFAPAVALGALLVFTLACGGETGDAASEAARAPSQATGEVTPASAEPAAPKPRRNERPLPAFSGSTFDGKSVAVSDLLGRRIVLFFFTAGSEEAVTVGRAIRRIAPFQRKHNFQIVGVATGTSSAVAERFIEDQGYDFEVLNDASGAIARRLGLRVPAAVVLVDAEGYVTGAIAGLPPQTPDPEKLAEEALRQELRLPAAGSTPTAPGLRPPAPDFQTVDIDGDPVSLSALRGRPVVLIFFLYTCPHCHHALEAIRKYTLSMPEEQRPAIIGVSVSGSPNAVRAELAKKNLAFFPVVADADRGLRKKYASFAGVPDIFLIDQEGRIVSRTQGWREDRDPPLLRMRLASITGQAVPMLLHGTGYSGNEFCGVCHEAEAATWHYTKHSRAFDTLVKHGAEHDPECVGCHVVGFGQPGGYTFSPPTPDLENVGCESCHGRGGPHLSPGFVQNHDYQSRCVTCHDTKHSLGFDYATFLPKVSHASNAYLLTASDAVREAKLAELGKPREALMGNAEFVGSAACQGCHAAEYASWSEHAHAKALASLEAEGKQNDADCLACHTTGYDRPGGFPAGGKPADHPARVGVGCESCHGPGGDHVAEGARRIGTIISLGDKCDSCVILQICGSCHDDANDPEFEFSVQEKIDRQRHGTTEPGTGKPKDASNADASAPGRAGALERAFALSESTASGS